MTDPILKLLARLLTEAKIEVNDARLISFELARLRQIEKMARDLIAESEVDDDFEGQYIDWLVPNPEFVALRTALGEEFMTDKEALAEAEQMLASSEIAADAEITRLRATIATLRAALLKIEHVVAAWEADDIWEMNEAMPALRAALAAAKETP
jgi:hypothetical protein